MTHLLSLAPQKSKFISKLKLITVIKAEKFTILKTLQVELMEIHIHKKPLGKGINHIMCFLKLYLCRVLKPIIWVDTKFEQNGK